MGARPAKKHDERKNELLDIAENLIFKIGYESVTISHIIKTANIAKGTFYHYFKSKEDLLNQIVMRKSDKVLDQFSILVDDEDLNALDKFKKIIALSNTFRIDNIDLLIVYIKAMYRDENLLFRHKQYLSFLTTITPLYAKIIEQGVREGQFNVQYPVETAESIIMLGERTRERNISILVSRMPVLEKKETLKRCLFVLQLTIEKMLGLSDNSLIIPTETMEKFIDIIGEQL